MNENIWIKMREYLMQGTIFERMERERLKQLKDRAELEGFAAAAIADYPWNHPDYNL